VPAPPSDHHLPCCCSNPVALVGPLNSLALMPHLVKLSLSLPRLEDMEVDALAVLTSVTQLELISSHKARAVRGAGTTREPMCLPPPASLSALAHLRALDLEYVCAGEGEEAACCRRLQGGVLSAH
jgi:hypothetical protein